MNRSTWKRPLVAALVVPALVAACNSSSSGGDGGDQDTTPRPTVTISASPGNVDSGGTATLTWNASNADSCSASGSWSGSRGVTGNEDVGPLTANAEYTLTCEGAGGSATDSVTVTVNAAVGAPTLDLTVTPSSISQGASAMLEWTTTDADSCTATGAWTGPRPVSGDESTGSLSSSASYTLTCSGPGGDVSDTVSVSVTSGGGSGISGNVDSSHVDRFGENRIYVYAGSVTPDDYDGDAGDPILSVDVTQDEGACTFGYDSGALADGDYTVAFTNAAADDDPQQDDAIEFRGVSNITLASGGQVVDIDAANILRVGPGRAYATVAAAAAAAQNGDVVEIDAGVYSADVAAWYQDNLTLRGVGGYAHLRADGANSQGKAIWVIAGNDVVVENIEFSGITVPDQNGAGIRAEGWNLAVCNGYFHDSEEGILGGSGTVLVEYSEFDNNGFGDGFSHNMYILDAERFILRHSYSHHARIGHNVKTRARENYILYNRIMDEGTGTSSYAVDIPNGGLSYLIGNLMQQGPNTDNSSIVNYGTEGLSGGRTHNLYIVNNTIVDDYGGTFVQTAGGTSLVSMTNNLLVGSGTVLTGAPGQMTTNLQTTAPGLVDIDNYDYRLTAGSPAVDAGTAPGQGDGLDLTPEYQYLHRATRELRPTDASIDIGAYEF